MSPPYRIPYRLLLPRIPSLLTGQRRSLGRDLEVLFATIDNAPRVIDAECIPQRDAFLLVMNHFHRADIPAWWSALAAVRAVAVRRAGHAPNDVRMIIASQWTYARRWQHVLIEPLMHLMIGRIAQAYNLVTIEPTALGVAHAAERAQSIRHVLAAAKQAVRNGEPFGLAPEGGDSTGGGLMCPPTGAGRFMLLLANSGMPLLPVGVFADGDRLVTRFAESFLLTAPHALSKPALDDWAAHDVMRRIAQLLPRALRGVYREAL